jgi:hypothetical protein
MSRDFFYLPRRLSYSLRRNVVDWIFPLVHRFGENNYFNSSVPSDPSQLMEYYRHRKTPRFHFGFEEIEKICSNIPSERKEKTVRTAEDIVRHKFTFRGHEPIVLDSIRWDYSPNSDFKWKTGWIWDLNRHFYFTTLGFAYWYTRDVRFARAFFELSSSWIESNISRLGKLPWDHPFEVAARLNAWIWAYFLFLHCPEWRADEHYEFLMGLERLSEYLYQVIEYHSPGNHILLEAKALVLCAELFPEFKGAKRWADKAWRILRREVKAQICEDGVHAERSTMYHRIVAGELSELLLICYRNNISRADTLPEVVRKMADFEIWIDTGEGSVPLFGDAYLEDTYLRFSAPAIVAALGNQGKLSPIPFNQGDQNYWALGINWERENRVYSSFCFPKDLAKAFPSGGYFVSRSSWGKEASLLVWDCGPVGYHANPYHSHLDSLSFNLTINGIPILIDPGTDEPNQKMRKYFRGTAAHNTVVIDGENQSILAKRNEVWAPAQANLIFWGTIPECDVMVGSHNGYKRLTDPVLHIRTIITMRNRYWLVFDRIEGNGHHKAEQRFHLAPGSILEWVVPQQQLLISRQDAVLSFLPLRFLDNGGKNLFQQTQIETGLAELKCGQPHEIQVINSTCFGPIPFSLGAVLIPEKPQARGIPAQVLSIDNSLDLQAVEIQGNYFNDKIFFRLGKRKMYKFFNGWETDGRIVILRYGERDVITDIFVADASMLIYNSHNLLGHGQIAPLQKITFKNDNLSC